MHHNLRQHLQVLWQSSFLGLLSVRVSASCCRPSSHCSVAYSSVFCPNLCWDCWITTLKCTSAPTGCADIHAVFSSVVSSAAAAGPGSSSVSVVSVFSAAAAAAPGYAYCWGAGGRTAWCPSRVMPPDRGRARGRVVSVFDPHRRDVLTVVLCRDEDP